ncbi:hypothetical protein A0H81_09972 [Grifola frondosa]|uniref:Uncharacterized protein n=1 Tax=Grifola frondosa TaxID=5627 RepID=A0A1C7M0L0_GRIFR|nr:hypothetical protein A0H81_09972 [Grifola frondosa]
MSEPAIMPSDGDKDPKGEEKPSDEDSSRTMSAITRRPSRLRSDVGSVLARHVSVTDAVSLTSIDRPPSEEEKLPPSKIYHPLSFPVLVLLMPASIFGVLARLGLQAITGYDGHSIFPLAWVQAIGCLVMGFVLGIRDPFGRFYGPLYTAMTTGFCGSLTTFSGWQLDVFSSWINSTGAHHDWFRDAIDGIGKSVFTLAISLSAVSLGAHLSTLVAPVFPALPPPPRSVRYCLSALAILVYAAAYPAYFRMSPASGTRPPLRCCSHIRARSHAISCPSASIPSSASCRSGPSPQICSALRSSVYSRCCRAPACRHPRTRAPYSEAWRMGIADA